MSQKSRSGGGRPKPNRPMPADVGRALEQRGRDQQVISTSWEGPVPPPAVIEAYDRLVPGAAQVMWSNFDEQSTHRRDLEQKVVTGSEKRADRGQVIAAGLIALAMICGLIIALAVNAVAGGTVVLGSIVSGAAIYIAGGRQPKVIDPDEEKTPELD